MTHPADLPATSLLAMYRTGALSPREAIDGILERIAMLDPEFNAFRLVDADSARIEASAAEARWSRGEPKGLLDGVPVTLKDLLDVRGWPTRMGSLATTDAPALQDSPAAARLREQGAILLGKTNTSEFGAKGVTESALAGITRNPWDPARSPGGSSGGAAVATALGMGPLHMATDGGGSIRRPAAACGVFGFKPSFGRVPCYPNAHSGTVFHVGPMARNVRDAVLIMNVIGAWDARDWSALPHDGRDWRIGLDDGIAGLRVAYSRTLGYIKVEPEVATLVDRAAARMAELGAIVGEVDPGFDDPAPIFRVLWEAGVAKLLRDLPSDRHALLDDALHQSAERGRAISVFDYLDAQEQRAELAVQLRRFHERYDVLLTPTLAAPAPRIGKSCPAPFCLPFNLTQQPAASVPCGITASGLPVGMQIIGPAHRDDLVLRAAYALESAQPWQSPTPWTSKTQRRR